MDLYMCSQHTLFHRSSNLHLRKPYDMPTEAPHDKILFLQPMTFG